MKTEIHLPPYRGMFPCNVDVQPVDVRAMQSKFFSSPLGVLARLFAAIVWNSKPKDLGSIQLNCYRIILGNVEVLASTYLSNEGAESLAEFLSGEKLSSATIEKVNICPFPCFAAVEKLENSASILVRAKAPTVGAVLELSFNGNREQYDSVHAIIWDFLSSLKSFDSNQGAK